MTAFNAVRFKVKPGREQDFLDAHRDVGRDWAGLRHASIIAEWDDMDSMAAARPA